MPRQRQTLRYHLLLVVLLACLRNVIAADEPAFVFEDPLRFTLTSSATATNTISFLVFAKANPISNVSVTVRTAKTPDGQLLPKEAATAAISSSEVTKDGSSISVKINPASFTQPGEYRITLIVEGKVSDKTIRGIPSVVIVRPVAEINVDELKDQTLHLVRSWPFGTAQGVFPLNLQEVSGKSDIKDVHLTSQGILVKETRERVPGTVTVTPASQTATATSAYTNANLNLKVEGVEKTGVFESTLIVNAPTLSGRKLIPLRLSVTDCAFWPFLVITLGVLGGFWTSHVFNEMRPRQLNKASILRLRAELSRFRQRVKSATDVWKVENMWRSLRAAEDSNEVSDLAQVKTQLQQIEKDLDDFRKTLATARAETQKALTDLKSKVQVYWQTFDPLEPDEKSKLQTIDVRLADVEWLLRQDYVDDAREKLAAVGDMFLSVRERRLTNQFEQLRTVFTDLKGKTSAEDQRQSETLLTEAHALLTPTKLDELELKLEQLKFALQELSTKILARAARGPAPSSQLALAESRVVPPRPQINIITLPDQRTTDVDISLEISDAGDLLEENDRFLWNFGEPNAEKEGGPSTTYRYREVGDYEIRVDVIRDKVLQPDLSITEQVKILPGKTERALLDIMENVRAYDVALSVIALVLASLTGLLFLYVGKTFGTLSDYLLALFWGFGVDNSVRGFASVMSRMTSSEGAK